MKNDPNRPYPYLNPLFWQRGDPHDDIEREMRLMKANGINEFVVEPRPHPDYLGEGWWRDLDFILDRARALAMRVWLFDDGDYPSGKANGEIAKRYPEYTKRYWAESHIDVTGPQPRAHFLMDEWLRPGETILRVLAARRASRGDEIDSDTLVDLSRLYARGRVYWAVPAGDWRVFIVKASPYGEEAHTRDYVNPLSRAAVGKYIEIVHEAHYARYKADFGGLIAGFFTDEPRFGNICGYDRAIGSCRMPLPCDEGLLERLCGVGLGDFALNLPLLWYKDAQGVCRDARYAYMDAVSRLFAENFTGQLGDWCRAHNVKLVGHLVEENGAHARLGYGAGHFFRAMNGLDAAGIDVVDNLLPEQTSGTYLTAFNEFDCDFNHWGLAKMASSAAHADPKKGGATLCEAFGAYGWFEGLRLMKWITDRLVVQGVNILTPHAFSPSPFPDPDCPPHFYARGQNPQFRLFHVWSAYANRMCDMISGASHVAPVAVLYHAEAEWGGAYEPFEKAVKSLAMAQIDCDVVCADALCSPAARTVAGGRLAVGDETFAALVVPYAQNIAAALADRINAFIESGLPVYFTRALPERRYFGGDAAISGAQVVETGDLPARLREEGLYDVLCEGASADLQYAHYRRDGEDVYLFENQSALRSVDARVRVRDARRAILYDAMDDARWAAEQAIEGGESVIRLRLAPYETVFALFSAESGDVPRKPEPGKATILPNEWRISAATASEYPAFSPLPFTTLDDLSKPDKLPDFAGTVRYEQTFSLDAARDMLLDLGEVYELASVSVNGAPVGTRICPPYRVFLPKDALRAGENRLRVEVVNTLVKACHDNPFDRYFPQEPTGLLGEVALCEIQNA